MPIRILSVEDHPVFREGLRLPGANALVTPPNLGGRLAEHYGGEAFTEREISETGILELITPHGANQQSHTQCLRVRAFQAD